VRNFIIGGERQLGQDKMMRKEGKTSSNLGNTFRSKLLNLINIKIHAFK